MKQLLQRRIALTLIGIGLILTAVGFLLGGKEYVAYANLNDFSLKGKQTVQKIELIKEPLKDFQELDVRLDVANFTIEPSNDEYAYLSYLSTNRDIASTLRYQEKDGTLVLEKTRLQNFFIDISFFNNLFNPTGIGQSDQLGITLYLPEKMLDTDSIHVEVGTATLSHLQAKQAKISVESGKLVLTDTTFATLKARNEVGNTTFKQNTIDELTFQSESGNLILEENTLHAGTIHSEFGNMTLDNSQFNNTQFKTESGTIKGQHVTFIGENNLKSEYGDITLGLTKSTLQDTHFFLQTEHGKVSVRNLTGKQTTTSFESNQKAQHIFNATIESGNITIE